MRKNIERVSLRNAQTILAAALLCLLIPAAAAAAQENPIMGHSQHMYGGVKYILLSSAEKMPEEDYSFRPTDSVRSFGEIIGHLADSQYGFCSVVLGEKSPGLKIEKTKASKADLIAALKEACAYCERAYKSLTDASAADTVKLFGSDHPKLGVLTVNTVHSIEHYGNLVTYLRMKNIVPPTSEPGFMARATKK